MNSTIHSRFRSFFLTAALLTAAAAPALAADPCDALLADASALESVRSGIDAACPCGQYDGSEGNGRAEFKRCVSGQIRLAIESEDLRKVCKGLLKKMYAAAVCGSGNGELAPCVEQSATGKVRCRIRTATDCQARSGDVCFHRPTCVDGADTTGDMVVDGDDSGVCFPPPSPTTSTTTTTSTSTTTTTSTTVSTTSTTTTTVPRCGDGSPDIRIEADRDTYNYEVVMEGGYQTPGGGGLLLHPRDAHDSVFFYADGSTDERVCSQNDAALAYHWDIFFPPTLQGAAIQAPWIHGYDSPVLEIPPSGLPDLAGTEARADFYWRVRLTVTPLPLQGEQSLPPPSQLWFRFAYVSSEMVLFCYDKLFVDPTCNGPACAEICSSYCDMFPEYCQ